MGIPFMDISNTVNSMVNDAVGIPPAAPEPSGPIDITDQCTIDIASSWKNGGIISITTPTNYAGYYCEVITGWPENSSINNIGGRGLDNRHDTIDGNNIISTGVLVGSKPQIITQVNSGSGITSNPRMISVKVSETEF